MDINKWKSVAVKKETHVLLTALCDEKDRNPARMISKLVKDYAEYQAKKKGISVDKYISQLLKKNGSK
jgi:predicted HicB family RNase H-like nuclease|tara:strand:+ start:285 stop:488 length:204 start_codon:yes stop_codon:yes gene_type:complete